MGSALSRGLTLPRAGTPNALKCQLVSNELTHSVISFKHATAPATVFGALAFKPTSTSACLSVPRSHAKIASTHHYALRGVLDLHKHGAQLDGLLLRARTRVAYAFVNEGRDDLRPQSTGVSVSAMPLLLLFRVGSRTQGSSGRAIKKAAEPNSAQGARLTELMSRRYL